MNWSKQFLQVSRQLKSTENFVGIEINNNLKVQSQVCTEDDERRYPSDWLIPYVFHQFLPFISPVVNNTCLIL